MSGTTSKLTGGALTYAVDGSEPLTAASVKALASVCDQAEDQAAKNHRATGTVTVTVTGVPAADWTSGLDVMLVSKWERALRRLERLPVATVAVAVGDVGGPALDAFLATDVRVATPGARLLVSSVGASTWPGMAAYRLVQQAGAARVRQAVLFGRPVTASEALTMGVVDEVAEDPAAAVAAVAEWAGELSGKEVSIRRQLLFDDTTTSFEDALGPHLAAIDRVLRNDATENAEENAAEGAA
jgi:isomerase DpgB